MGKLTDTTNRREAYVPMPMVWAMVEPWGKTCKISVDNYKSTSPNFL